MATFDEYVAQAQAADSQDDATKFAILALLTAVASINERLEDLEAFVRDAKYGA